MNNCKHDWRYNFPSIPNKRVCIHCNKREKLNLTSLEWDGIFHDPRTKEELTENWFN